MPRIAPLTKRRWMIMQLVLVGVLAGTVALAALVSRVVEGALDVTLGPPQKLATLSVRLPEGWSVAAERPSADAILIQAASPDGQTPTRLLEIRHIENPRGLTADQALTRLLPRDYPRDPRVQVPHAQLRPRRQAPVGGVSGVMQEGFRVAPDDEADPLYHEVFLSGQSDSSVVLLHLRTGQTIDVDARFANRLLARKIAESICVEESF